MTEFYGRYLDLIDEIERRFPVSSWKCADFEIWPLARMDLYLDMYWAGAGIEAPRHRALPLRIAARVATPLRNAWKTRRDVAHQVTRPAPAHAIFLGDGFSLDRVDDAWQDRFGEPLIAALERRGLATFLMQGKHLDRLPWRRPTYAANRVESRGFLRTLIERLPVDLPGHGEVLQFLARHAVQAPSLRPDALARHANLVASTAKVFERVLREVRPAVAFVVGYYAGLGPAFVLACRRQRILSVDLQRAPHAGARHAYHWPGMPVRGYATLPAMFWCWTKGEAARIDAWAGTLAAPWHGAIHGGHTQMAPYLDDDHPTTRSSDARFDSLGQGATFEREILVALQPIHGHRAVWEKLRSQIEASPHSWRWWIRRHPASGPDQDVEAARLIALRRPNVMIAEASSLPLPALLRHMSALVSLSSGAAVEASMFGVPAFFLIDAARHTFGELITRGAASLIDAGGVNAAIAGVQPASVRTRERPPAVDDLLLQLEDRARAYRELT